MQRSGCTNTLYHCYLLDMQSKVRLVDSCGKAASDRTDPITSLPKSFTQTPTGNEWSLAAVSLCVLPSLLPHPSPSTPPIQLAAAWADFSAVRCLKCRLLTLVARAFLRMTIRGLGDLSPVWSTFSSTILVYGPV